MIPVVRRLFCLARGVGTSAQQSRPSQRSHPSHDPRSRKRDKTPRPLTFVEDAVFHAGLLPQHEFDRVLEHDRARGVEHLQARMDGSRMGGCVITRRFGHSMHACIGLDWMKALISM